MMRSLTTTQLRRNMAKELDAVISSKEQIVITRPRGSAVIMDLSEWEAMKRLAGSL